MKKRLALAAAFAFSIIPFTSFADHLEPDEDEITTSGHSVRADVKGYEQSIFDLSDEKLIAGGPCIGQWNINQGNPHVYLGEAADTLSGLNLKDTSWVCTHIEGTVIKDLFKGTNLSGTIWERVYMVNVDMRGADLSGATIRDTIWMANRLSNADLSDVNIRDSEIVVSNLTGANLSGATMINVNLSDVNLTGANLEDADLSDVNLTGANLEDADLSGADLTDVIAENLIGCPSLLPESWVCQDNSLIEEVEEVVEEEEDIEEEEVVVEEEVEEEVVIEEEVLEEETAEAEDIDFDSITKDDLPLKVYCPDRGADLIIREKKKKKGYVVKITRRRGERFFDGRKFRKAVKKFKKALENEC